MPAAVRHAVPMPPRRAHHPVGRVRARRRLARGPRGVRGRGRPADGLARGVDTRGADALPGPGGTSWSGSTTRGCRCCRARNGSGRAPPTAAAMTVTVTDLDPRGRRRHRDRRPRRPQPSRGVVVEETDDWFALSPRGNVWYLGEHPVEYGAPGPPASRHVRPWGSTAPGGDRDCGQAAPRRRLLTAGARAGGGRGRATVLELDGSLDLAEELGGTDCGSPRSPRRSSRAWWSRDVPAAPGWRSSPRRGGQRGGGRGRVHPRHGRRAFGDVLLTQRPPVPRII